MQDCTLGDIPWSLIQTQGLSLYLSVCRSISLSIYQSIYPYIQAYNSVLLGFFMVVSDDLLLSYTIVMMFVERVRKDRMQDATCDRQRWEKHFVMTFLHDHFDRVLNDLNGRTGLDRARVASRYFSCESMHVWSHAMLMTLQLANLSAPHLKMTPQHNSKCYRNTLANCNTTANDAANDTTTPFQNAKHFQMILQRTCKCIALFFASVLQYAIALQCHLQMCCSLQVCCSVICECVAVCKCVTVSFASVKLQHNRKLQHACKCYCKWHCKWPFNLQMTCNTIENNNETHLQTATPSQTTLQMTL